MRLLNTRTLELEEFLGKPPPYSILSHVWGEGEVSFQDVTAGNYRQLEGYAKLAGCCRVSLLEGYGYTWIDTCCIDKTSSAELSEAINSMFSWYMNAQICYAHLADVQDVSSLARSRWFTRGWTLQELIAPPAVVFLSSSWSELGTRTTLADTISAATGIQEAVLKSTFLRWSTGYDIRSLLRQYSIACKMSWAAKRTTTRVEDMAYCLLGLFDVNMALIYGEGDKAFYRLQRELLNETDDSSIFAWSTLDGQSPDRDTGLLAPSPRYFEESGDVLRPRREPNDPVSQPVFEMIKSNIRLRAPYRISWASTIGNEEFGGKQVRFRAKNAVEGCAWGGVATWELRRLLEWTEQIDKPKVFFRENVLASITAPKENGNLEHSPEPFVDIFIALLDCSTAEGKIGLLLKRDSRGLVSRRHSTTILRFLGDPYLPPVLKRFQELSIPARFVEPADGFEHRAQRASDDALRDTTNVTARLTTRLDGSGYVLSKERCITSLYRPSQPLEELHRTTSGAWKCLVFEHPRPEIWPPFLIFYEYVSEGEVRVDCRAVPEAGVSHESIDALREALSTKSSLAASEVRTRLAPGWEAVLKVREPLGSRDLVVFLDGGVSDARQPDGAVSTVPEQLPEVN